MVVDRAEGTAWLPFGFHAHDSRHRAAVCYLTSRTSSLRARITNGIAMVAPIVVMLGIFFVPESPRWAYLHKARTLR
ncbi:hypothetical protein PsorP6_005635 [Peronosclerospora sorghi]|uniref:Uncharacterized protein n=1 Tax=Peronosclerospora sorghi TaxID=230839 RepID=A0ACC0W6T5_9STRA|nr:hypothetical protein PsorP6_005635 [Peronosclerospora sorghi]